jgi:hypothetical protein
MMDNGCRVEYQTDRLASAVSGRVRRALDEFAHIPVISRMMNVRSRMNVRIDVSRQMGDVVTAPNPLGRSYRPGAIIMFEQYNTC